MNRPASELFDLWIKAKAAEKQANENRVHIEAEIYTLFKDKLKDDGSVTIKDVPGFKLAVTTGYTRKWDQDALNYLIAANPIAAHAFKTEYKEDKKIFNSLPENLIGKFNKALTEKPRKPGFKVERL